MRYIPAILLEHDSNSLGGQGAPSTGAKRVRRQMSSKTRPRRYHRVAQQTLKCVVSTVLLACPLQAVATPSAEPTPHEEPAAAAENRPKASAEEESLDHRFQVGLGARIGSGFRVVFPYSNEFCGQLDGNGDSKQVCTDRYPMWIELSPSFGLTESLELLVDFRIFLESPEFTSATGVGFAPGIKYYTDPRGSLKFFLTGQAMFELQDQREGSGLDNFDIGLRSAFGFQIDLLRYIGLYAQAGLVVGFKRWFSFIADLAGGVQVRY